MVFTVSLYQEFLTFFLGVMDPGNLVKSMDPFSE